MKKVFAPLLAVVLFAFVIAPQFAQAQGGGTSKLRKVRKAIPEQYIVVLKQVDDNDSPENGPFEHRQ